MNGRPQKTIALALIALHGLPAQSGEAKPVQVYVLAGQSNMLEMGDVSGRNWRHQGFFLSAAPDAKKGVAVSVYEGRYDPDKDYDTLAAKAAKTVIYDGMGRDPFPKVDGEAIGYHYHRNAETYMLIGEALGRGMIELIGSRR